MICELLNINSSENSSWDFLWSFSKSSSRYSSNGSLRGSSRDFSMDSSRKSSKDLRCIFSCDSYEDARIPVQVRTLHKVRTPEIGNYVVYSSSCLWTSMLHIYFQFPFHWQSEPSTSSVLIPIPRVPIRTVQLSCSLQTWWVFIVFDFYIANGWLVFHRDRSGRWLQARKHLKVNNIRINCCRQKFLLT